MPITINGDGTVTGISAGGLPDGSISTADIADDAISSAKIADDAVTLAKLSTTGTPGAGNFLRGDNSWQEAGGGAWNFIGTTVASGSPTTLTVTGLSSTYATYYIIGEELGPTSASHCWLRFGDSGGIDSGGSDYADHVIIQEIGSTGYNAGSANTDSRMRLMYGNGISSTTSFSAILHGNEVTHKPMIKGECYFTSTGQKSSLFSGWRLAAMTVTQIQFGFVSGDVAYGRLSVWGIAHA